MLRPDYNRFMKKFNACNPRLARDVMMKLNTARWHGIFEPAEGNILCKICVHIARTAVRVFPRNYFTQKLIRNSMRYAGEDTKQVGNFASEEKRHGPNYMRMTAYMETGHENCKIHL